jgi:hypothetical protein
MIPLHRSRNSWNAIKLKQIIVDYVDLVDKVADLVINAPNVEDAKRSGASLKKAAAALRPSHRSISSKTNIASGK